MVEPIASPFEFVAEIAALDLVNTEVIIRRKQRDLLKTPQDLVLWWEHAQHYDATLARVYGAAPRFDADLLKRIKVLRGSLRRIFTAVIEERAVDEGDMGVLNEALGLGHPMLAWEVADNPQVGYWYGNDRGAGVLLPVGLSALHILTNLDLGRLRQCHNNHCILVFYDTTKSATRQWCTTKCFDRERAARRYEEQRSEEGE